MHSLDNINMEVEELEDDEEEEEEDGEGEEKEVEEESGGEEEEEEEDIDFNPFIREHSPEASSSLSSDNEYVHDTPIKPPNENFEEEQEIIVQSGINAVNNVISPMQVDVGPHTKQNSSMETLKEEVDAISRRTRARHSLANYTLEELETFLQESDDERDLPNVDDQEEYRKFLAAVLLEEGNAESEDKVNENVDEDEDNDADFELELEEALMDSDMDENLECNNEEDAKRVTRQKNTKNLNNNKDNTLLSQAMVPWRPILPYGYTPPQDSYNQLPHPQVYQNLMQPVYSFAPKQIGQLHCLIHEHVQLLIQIYSVCVLDVTKKDIACEYRRMILEIMSRREESLVVQKVPYPENIFKHPNVCPSYQDNNSLNWAPQIKSPVLSVLDVAPLRIAKEFMDDVNNSVLDQGQSCLDAYKTYLRAPLFSLPQNDVSLDTWGNSPRPAESKKSLASTLIDRTKKQSVALVPINIVKLAQVFYPLFNAALFPYKPPPQAVVKRILFTESEDGLLAMGYMEYNHDWKAIRQRFLPCKNENQIFVRHKNRISSNAPDNPIKEIHRIKVAPLTIEEKARISEAMKLLKNDWMAIWKCVVPHKDPALLPRLWRIANGTQKSYKKSEEAKAKRRMYDIKRRKQKASVFDCQMTGGKKNDNQVDKRDNSAGDIDGEDETYVHEAFLADSASKNANRNNTQSVNMSPSKGKQNASMVNASTIKKPSGNLVKLAPNLPPINLPSSVTVIRKADIDKNTVDKTPNVTQSERVGSFLSNSWRNLNNGNVNINLNVSQPGAGENTNDSFLMHPLLFQSPEICRPSHFPNRNLNQSTPPLPTTQNSLHSSLFDKVTKQQNSADSDFGASNAGSLQNKGQFDRTPSSNERNFIDLNVRLSSESDDEETYHPERRSVEENSNEAYGIGNASLDVDKISNEKSERGLPNVEDSLANGKGGHRVSYTGDIGYDLVPGIVMEQEELSDSEDDVENVHFEREELDDSEDEIGGEQFNELQIKEISFLPSKEVEIQSSQSRRSKSRYNKRKGSPVMKSEKSNADAVITKRPSRNNNPPATSGRKRK